jgi:histidinol dehydrogenase
VNRALFPERSVDELIARQSASIPESVMESVRAIVADVRIRGEPAVRDYAARFDRKPDDEPLVLDRDELADCLREVAPADRDRLRRAADRIASFAHAQLETLRNLNVDVEGGHAGHVIAPVERAGCYAPAGRHPLPSSVLMTAVTARVAGVSDIWLATPRLQPIMLAAAAAADVDAVLIAGGAHAVAALAFGAGAVPRCDVVVGPGNAYVTAAKEIVAGRTRIDMLAGPSELVIIADSTATPRLVAADLLAQAEHDPAALPVLITTDTGLVTAVRSELETQLEALSTREVARAALTNGGVVQVSSLRDACLTCDALAPEHVQLCVTEPAHVLRGLRHYGAAFVGEGTSEVFGDYGIGPNHVLPTGGTARTIGGLSVFTFLRVRTWIEMVPSSDQSALATEIAWLARLEGLEGHARAAEARIPQLDSTVRGA